MADDVRILIKAILDTKDMQSQLAELAKEIIVKARVELDSVDLKRQINAVAGEGAKSGSKYKIKYGVDRGDFVKQFRAAGEEAKRGIQKIIGSGEGIKVPMSVSTKAIDDLEARLNGMGLGKEAINQATAGLAAQNIQVSKISEGFRTIGAQQEKLASVTISGTDALGRQVNLVQKFDLTRKKYLQTETQITAKFNEQGQIVNKMATSLRTKDIGTIKEMNTNDLATFVERIKNAGLYTDEMRDKTSALAITLKNAFSKEGMTEFLNQFDILKTRFKTIQEAAREASRPSVNTIDKNVGILNQTLAFKGMDGQTAGVTNLRNEITSLVAEYGRLKISMDGLDPSSAEFQALATQVDGLDARFKSASQAAAIFNDSVKSNAKLANVAVDIKKAKSSLDELEMKWSKFKGNPQLLGEFQQLRTAAQQLDATNLQNFNKQLAAFKTHVRAAGADTRNFGDELKNALAKFGIWMSAGTILMQGIRRIRDMVNAVKELDTALVEFNKIADLSSEELVKFTDRAFEAGKALARTGTEVLAASAIWKQAGYSVEESLKLAEASLMMQNVGDGIENVEMAASSLVAALKGFQLPAQDAERVLDALNNTSNNNAVGFAALAEGVQRASGVMRQSGTTMAETMGLLTGGFESLRNMEKVSTGLITLSQRIRGVNEDGEEIDGLAPKLQAIFKEIANVDVQDQNGNLRSTYDILQDLAGAWDTLSSKQKQYIGERAAGIRQISVFNAIIDNFRSVQKATDDAANSAGSARIENEKFLDSIQGRLNNLTSAFQAFSANTINSGFIKGIVDATTALVTLIDKIGALPALLTGLSLFTSIFSGNKLAKGLLAFTGHLAKLPSTLLTTIRLFREGKSTGLGFGDSLAYAGVKASTAQIAFTGVLLAVMAIKLAFDAYNQSIEEQSRKAREFVDSWKESRETLAQTKETIADISGEFEKLGKGVDSFGNNLSLTTDEFSKYHQITNQIAGMFPELVSGYDSQGNAILAVKSSVEELNKAYEAQIALANSEVVRGAPTVFADTRKTYSAGTFLDSTTTSGKMSSAQRLYDALVSGETGMTVGSNVPAVSSLLSDMGSLASIDSLKMTGKITVKPEDVASAKQFLSSYMRTIDAEIASLAGDRKSIISAYLFNSETYQGADKQTKSIVDYVVANLDNEFVLKQDTLSGMMNAVYSTVLDSLALNDGLTKTIAATAKVGDSFRESEKSISDYSSAYANLQKEMDDLGLDELVVEAVNKSMADPKGYDPLITNIKNKLVDEFDDMVESMTLQDLRLASALEVPEGTLLTWDELQDRIYTTRNILTSLTLTENVASLKTAAEAANKAFTESEYHASITKEEYDKLIALGDDYAATVDSTNGYLTVNKQKLDALIASKQTETKTQIAFNKAQKLDEYEKNAVEIDTVQKALTLLNSTVDKNSDEYTKNFEILTDRNDALENSQDYLRDEIKAYDILSSELNYATSAYKRWLDAKNSPEAGDGYDELSVARKAIEEGLKSGKTGTNQYRAAEALLIPEEISAQGEAAVKKYMKSMGKYLTEDSTGLQKYINDLFKKGFLEEGADGSYFSTQKANIQDIAKELNITEEAARLMFAALKDYEWEVDIADSAFDSSAAIAKFEEATAKWETAKEYVEKLIKENASDAEIAAAKASEAEAKALMDAANVASLQVEVEVPLEEKLQAQIDAYQEAISKLEAIGVPATLLLNSENEAANLQIQLDSILAAKEIIATATAKLDDTTLKEQISALESPTNSEGTSESPIQLAVDAYLTDLYKSALAQVEADKDQAGTVSISATTTDFDATMTGLGSGSYGATVNVDANVDPFERKLEGLQKKWDEIVAGYSEANENAEADRTPPPWVDPDSEEITLSESGTYGNDDFVTEQIDKLAQATTETWAGTVVGDEGLIVNVDTEDAEVSLEHLGDSTSAVVDEVTQKQQEITSAFKRLTEKELSSAITEHATDESWANYLAEKIGQLEKRRKILDAVGMSLSAGDIGALSAYQEALDKLTTPKEIIINAETDGAIKSADKLVRDIEGKSASITVRVKPESTVAPYAKGTKKAKRGVALTGEEGVETVFDRDGFYTVGNDGPELVNLKGGEEILSNDDTKKLFRGRGKRASGQAFAGATSTLSKLWASTKKVFDEVMVKPVTKAVEAVKTITAPITKMFTTINKGGGDTSAVAPVNVRAKGDKTIGGDSGSKGGGGGSADKDKEPDVVDWIPTLLERLRKQTEKIVEQSDSLVKYTDQNAKLDEAINSNTQSIDANNSAYNRYIQQAESIAQKGLSADIIDKIKNGAIEIQTYDENTQKLISDYQKWYDLAQDTLDTVSELRKEQVALATQKLGNIQKYYENRIGAYGNSVDLAQSAISLGQATGREIKANDYNGIFSDLQQQLRILREERAVYEQTFSGLVSSGIIKQGSNEWFEYTGNINAMDRAINDASISLDDFNDIAKNIPVKNLDIAMKYLNTVQSTLESVQGLREAQGNVLGTLDYEQLISVGMQQIKTLETQNKELKIQQNGLDVLSDEYQEIQDKIDGNLSSIWDIKTTQENWNDAIIDLDIAKLEEVNERYDKQLRTMEAIEGLEKARQRRNLVYREGEGFVYEADQSQIKTAQREFDDVMYENLIDTLEGLKKDDNVYDSAGNLIGKQFTSLDGVDFQNYLSSVLVGRENSGLLSGAIGQINYDALRNSGANANTVSFNGDIVLNGVNDMQGLAEAIRLQLPSYISQLWFSNNN